MAASLPHPKIVKKHKKQFRRQQAHQFKRIARTGYRKDKGIDGCVRRRFRGVMTEPKIGFGSNKRTRHMMPSGHKCFRVCNPSDVELLLLHTKTFAAEIAGNVSSKKRVAILEKAKALGVKVTNPQGRLRQEVAA